MRRAACYMSPAATARPAWARPARRIMSAHSASTPTRGALTPAGQPDPAAHAADPHGDRHPVRTHPGGVQQPQCVCASIASTPTRRRARKCRSPDPIDAGIFAHQVRATPDNRQVILVTRGHDAAGGKPEDPGALKVFDYRAGIAGQRGVGGTRRRLSDSARGIWIFIRRSPGSTCRWSGRTRWPCSIAARRRAVAGAACFAKPRWRGRVRPACGSSSARCTCIRTAARSMSPTAPATRSMAGAFAGGRTRWRCLRSIRRAASRRLSSTSIHSGIHPRCFHIDPGGRLLVVAHIMGLNVRDGDSIRPSRRGCRCSASPTTDGWTSHAPTTWMLGSGPCGGWG